MDSNKQRVISCIGPLIDHVCPVPTIANLIKEYAVPSLTDLYGDPRDARIVLLTKDEQGQDIHKYVIQSDGKDGWCPETESVSVSTFVHQFFKEFVPDDVIRSMRNSWAQGRNLETTYIKYKGKTDDEIKLEWKTEGDTASATGTLYHFYSELFYEYGIEPDWTIPEMKQLKEFHQEQILDKNKLPFRSEQRLFSDVKHAIVGSDDFLVTDRDLLEGLSVPRKDGREPEQVGDGLFPIDVYDWKFTKDPKTESQYYGNGPLRTVQDCNVQKWCINLNLYKWLLEACYPPFVAHGRKFKGFKVRSMYLVCMHRNRPTYLLVEVPPKPNEIHALLQTRLEQLLETRNAKRARLDSYFPFSSSSSSSSSLSSSSASSVPSTCFVSGSEEEEPKETKTETKTKTKQEARPEKNKETKHAAAAPAEPRSTEKKETTTTLKPAETKKQETQTKSSGWSKFKYKSEPTKEELARLNPFTLAKKRKNN